MSPRSFLRPARHFMRESLVDTRLVFQIGVDKNVNVCGMTPISSRPNGEIAADYILRTLSLEFTIKRSYTEGSRGISSPVSGSNGPSAIGGPLRGI